MLSFVMMNTVLIVLLVLNFVMNVLKDMNSTPNTFVLYQKLIVLITVLNVQMVNVIHVLTDMNSIPITNV